MGGQEGTSIYEEVTLSNQLFIDVFLKCSLMGTIPHSEEEEMVNKKPPVSKFLTSVESKFSYKVNHYHICR